MRGLVVLLVAGVVGAALLLALAVPEAADAGSRKKLHFTQTIASVPNPGQGQSGSHMALVLHPNPGTIYDGSVTYAAGGPVRPMILHEIGAADARGQPTWTVDGDMIYGMSLIGEPSGAGVLDFTGAALAFYSEESFDVTASVDGWIRGQPAEVLLQVSPPEIPKPSSLLSRTAVPVALALYEGVHGGEKVLYVVTDGSDEEYNGKLSEIKGKKIGLSSVLADVPQEAKQKLYIFKNGIKGGGIHGFQAEVVSAVPGDGGYSALAELVEVSWKTGQRPSEFETADDVVAAEEGGRITFEENGIVLNAPQVLWPGGQLAVRTGSLGPFSGGQVTTIDEEQMTATFVAHRSWGHDGRTTYCIVTDATPAGPAESMGVPHVPSSAQLLSHAAAVDTFWFRNGIAGAGALGFQPAISTASPGEENYSPMGRIYLVEWHDPDSAKILETKSDIDAFRDAGDLSVSIARPTNHDHIVNCPAVDPFQD